MASTLFFVAFFNGTHTTVTAKTMAGVWTQLPPDHGDRGKFVARIVPVAHSRHLEALIASIEKYT